MATEVKSVVFKNFSNEEFVCSWDGVPYRFPAGKEMYVEDWKANHFAKHLVNKVIYTMKSGKELILTDQVLRDKLLAQALPGETTVTHDEALDINVRAEVAEKEAEIKEKKAESTKVVVEEEFAELSKTKTKIKAKDKTK